MSACYLAHAQFLPAGHLNLYLTNILHRDPASGNILILKEVEHRTSEDISKNAFKDDPRYFAIFFGTSRFILTNCCRFDFLAPHLKICKGVIIDGDMAIRLDKERVTAKHRSVNCSAR